MCEKVLAISIETKTKSIVKKDFSNNSAGYNSLPDFRVVSSLQGLVSRPHVSKHAESKSDVSFIPNSGFSRHTSRDILQFQRRGKTTAIKKDFSLI